MISLPILKDNILFIWNLPYLVEGTIVLLIVYTLAGVIFYTSTLTPIIKPKDASVDYKSNISSVIVTYKDNNLSESIIFRDLSDIKLEFDKEIFNDKDTNYVKIIQR